MSKTAIQELIDIVEIDYNNGVEISMKVFYKMLTEAKETEKQQIKEAYRRGFVDGYVGKEKNDPEQYYKENYEKA